ncbi:MAG TPA: RNA methyltransferase [bacterium]|nr:RNA methyltransferase [bacterium]
MAPKPEPASELRRLRLLLRDAAARREQNRSVAEGPHLAAEALAAGLVRALWATPAAAAAPESKGLLAAARAKGLAPRSMEAAQLAKLSDTRTPQGLLCEIEIRALAPAKGDTLFLALDALQDPGNLGTLLRCAWACKAAVILGAGCADVWSPKVLRAGAGAQFHTALREAEDLAAELRSLVAAGVRCYATGPRAERNYIEADCRRALCWVLGSEGRGLGPEARAACDGEVRIAYPGGAESLNVAASGAVLLFETLRQRA